jgi:hypothetical protein
MLKSWIKGVRIILNDSLETDLGKYRDSVLEQLVSFAGKLDAMGKKIQVDLFDGYTMRDTSDPVYGKNDASSPYAKDGYTAFYTQDEYKEALINRIKHIAPVLNSIPNLTTVGIANELVYPPGDVGEELFAEWYRTMIPETVKALPDIPILSGAADPRMLPDKMTGLTAKSINSGRTGQITGRLFKGNHLPHDMGKSDNI